MKGKELKVKLRVDMLILEIESALNISDSKFINAEHVLSQLRIIKQELEQWKSSSCCTADEHETGCYPRSSFKPKPELPVGTILTVKEKWQNFYGVYYRCYLPDEMKDKGYSIPYYDIPADKAEVIEL